MKPVIFQLILTYVRITYFTGYSDRDSLQS